MLLCSICYSTAYAITHATIHAYTSMHAAIHVYMLLCMLQHMQMLLCMLQYMRSSSFSHLYQVLVVHSTVCRGPHCQIGHARSHIEGAILNFSQVQRWSILTCKANSVHLGRRLTPRYSAQSKFRLEHTDQQSTLHRSATTVCGCYAQMAAVHKSHLCTTAICAQQPSEHTHEPQLT